jgi:hypothetical protein
MTRGRARAITYRLHPPQTVICVNLRNLRMFKLFQEGPPPRGALHVPSANPIRGFDRSLSGQICGYFICLRSLRSLAAIKSLCLRAFV